MRVVIVGAGIGGVGAAIELRRNGFSDVTILESAPSLGGTWYHNTYPGCACDVPSHLYSYSYAQRTDWPRRCPPQADILQYLREVARQEGVDRLVVGDTHVDRCTWSDEDCHWTVESADGRVWTADAVVLATGQLHQPAVPVFPGADSFTGHSFHSARWDHDYDLRGKRVGVVGTGASAVQLIPEIATSVDRLVVFQRTANWLLPRNSRRYPPWLLSVLGRAPRLQQLRRSLLYHTMELGTVLIRHPRAGRLIGERASWAFMRRQVTDPELQRKIRPDYAWGCKRVLFTSDFLPALTRPNVTLVTDPITAMGPDGVLTADGTVHQLDCVIYATGFRTTSFFLPMEVTGVGGQRLADSWADGPHAYLGTCVPGFPSLFLMYGPNTNTSAGSIIAFEEAQAAFVRRALDAVVTRRSAAIEVKASVEADYNRALQARFDGTAWAACQSWYRDGNGRFVANWPETMGAYRRRLRSVALSDFVFHRRPADKAAPVPSKRTQRGQVDGRPVHRTGSTRPRGERATGIEPA